MRAIRVIIDIGMHLGLPVGGRLGAGRGPDLDAGAGPGVLRRAQRPRPRIRRERDRPLPRHARPGDQLQAGGAGLAGRPGGAREGGRAAGSFRPQVLAHGGAVARLARPGRPGRRTGSAVGASRVSADAAAPRGCANHHGPWCRACGSRDGRSGRRPRAPVSSGASASALWLALASSRRSSWRRSGEPTARARPVGGDADAAAIGPGAGVGEHPLGR